MHEEEPTTSRTDAGGAIGRRDFLTRSAGLTALAGFALAGCADATAPGSGGSGEREAREAASGAAGSTPERRAQAGRADEQDVDPASVGRRTIGVMPIVGSAEVAQRWVRTVRSEGEKAGWDIRVTDANGDLAEASSAWQNYLQSGVDGLIAAGFDPAQWAPQVKSAADRRVPYISIFSSWAPGVTANISSNYFVEGAQLASFVADATGGRGGVIVLNTEQIPSLFERERGFVATLRALAPEMRLLGRHELNLAKLQQDAFDATQTLLRRHPRGEVAALFGGWDGASLAGAQAIQASGRSEVIAVGTDGDQPALEALRRGGAHAATTGVNFEAVGRHALRQLARVFDGKPALGRQLYMQAPVITASNVPARGYADSPPELTTYSPY